jgi:hypothetical protein
MKSWRAIAPLVALSALMSGAAADELLLRRYVPITAYKGFLDDAKGGEGYTYMDVEDTFISKAQPDLNFGGADQLVIADPEDAILIAFRQLNRAISVGSEVTDVELWLYPAGEIDREATFALHRVNKAWRDGSSNGTKQTYAATFDDRFAGAEMYRRPWQQQGGGEMRTTKPSLTGKLGDFWNAERKCFVFKGPGLVENVRYWLGQHYRNHGWMLTVKNGTTPRGKLAFVSSDVFQVGDPATFTRPALRVVFTPKRLDQIKKPDLPDLDVTYIERTPRYTRYHDNGETTYERKMFRGDNVGIMKFPDYGNQQKWPDAGDRVTFTAHVKNAGTRPVKGPVKWEWRYNDKTVLAGEFKGELAPWAEWTSSRESVWAVDHQDHRNMLLEFEVDVTSRVQEITKNNNVVQKYMGAKTLKYWVEKGTYEYVKDYPCAYGSYSFEDYLQWHFDIWNDTYFDKSRFDGVAPDGCLERVTFDDFGIVDNGILQGGIHRPHDKWDPNFDGEWGTTWEVGKGRPKNEEDGFLAFLRTRRVLLEGSLLHEASHQTIGAYDVYWSNIEPSDPDKPNGKCKLKDETGFYITRGNMYPYSGLMGGSDTRPNPRYWDSTGLYEVNTVGGVNTRLPYRNGFYGEWQYDLPAACYVRLTSPDGTPLAGAKVAIWQTAGNKIDETTQVARDLAADKDGVLRLPDQDSLENADYTTVTGHTFRKKNPFGRPDVVGENITLLLQVNACGQRDYEFVRVTDYNNLYWLGQHDKGTVPLACRICPSDRLDLKTNVAVGAKVTASTGAETAGNLVDGKVETAWEGGQTKAGDYLVIELPEPQRVGLVQIVQDGAWGVFYPRFAITTAEDVTAPARDGFATQAPETFALAMCNDKDANNQRPTERWVTYAGKPRRTKAIRIQALAGGAARVSEIRVFAEQ